MKKDNCDRIIVESNAKMEQVISWYLQNKEWLEKEESFRAPMETGCVVLQEEELEFTFENKGDKIVELTIYPLGQALPIVTYDYRPEDHSISNHKYSAHLTAERQKLLEMTLRFDQTVEKEALKYHALMLFAAYYEEIVQVDEKQNQTRSKNAAKQLRKSSRQPLSLVKKTYVVKDFDSKNLRKHGEKRGYTKPNHEVSVRGYYRTNQNGKRVWVKPFTRYKDKGNKKNKEYRV